MDVFSNVNQQLGSHRVRFLHESGFLPCALPAAATAIRPVDASVNGVSTCGPEIFKATDPATKKANKAKAGSSSSFGNNGSR
jgi:hypothetical protein